MINILIRCINWCMFSSFLGMKMEVIVYLILWLKYMCLVLNNAVYRDYEI